MKHRIGRQIILFISITMVMTFFIGFQVANTGIKESLANTDEKQNLYDIEITSDMGFLETDILQIGNIDGIKEVEGVFTFPFLAEDKNGFVSERQAYTLMDTINVPALTEGRMPETSEECVVSQTCLSNQMGDTFTIKGDTKKNLYQIVGKIAFPFPMEEQEHDKEIVYFLKSAFPEKMNTKCYAITENENPETEVIQKACEEKLRTSYEVLLAEKKERAVSLKKEWKEKEERQQNSSETEKEKLLAKQKALGKVELKIDQDEANRFDKEQIARRRKEIETQKKEVAEQLGNYNDTYLHLSGEIKEAKERADEAQKEVEQIKLPQIHTLARMENQSYLTFLKGIEDIRTENSLVLLFLISFTMAGGIGIANTMLGVKKFGDCLFVTGVTSLLACLTGILLGNFWMLPMIEIELWEPYLPFLQMETPINMLEGILPMAGMIFFMLAVHALSYYYERKCIRSKKTGTKAILMIAEISFCMIAMVFAFCSKSSNSIVKLLLIDISVIGTAVIFCVITYAKMKKRVWDMVSARNNRYYPKKIVFHIIFENYMSLAIGSAIAMISAALSKSLIPFEIEEFWWSCLISTITAAVIMSILNSKIYFTLKKIR